MAAVSVEKMSWREINDLEAKIAKAKSAARETAKVDLKAKIDRLLQGSGFTIGDLYGNVGRGRGRPKTAVKYANPKIVAKPGRGSAASRTGWLLA